MQASPTASGYAGPGSGDGPRLRVDAARPERLSRALADLRAGLAGWRLPMALARLDIRNRYRGSVIGPFWLTLSTAAMLLGLGLLYATLFKYDLREYLPHLAASLIVWNAIAGIVGDACVSLTSQEGVIRQIRLPHSVHALRCVFRNLLTAAHNLPLVLVVFLACGLVPGWGALLALPGLALIAADALAAALLLGMVCARFRDIGQIVASVMQIAFFLTPVIWKPELLEERARYLPLNPFYPLLEIVRAPLVGEALAGTAWLSALGWSALLWALALAVFVRFRARVAFWV